MFTQDNEIKTKIYRRIQITNKYYFEAGILLRSKTLSKKLKLKIFKTLIGPIILYGFKYRL